MGGELKISLDGLPPHLQNGIIGPGPYYQIIIFTLGMIYLHITGARTEIAFFLYGDVIRLDVSGTGAGIKIPFCIFKDDVTGTTAHIELTF